MPINNLLTVHTVDRGKEHNPRLTRHLPSKQLPPSQSYKEK